MERRNFIKSSISLGALAAFGPLVSFAGEAKKLQAKHSFNLKYAPHFGMFKESAGENLIGQLKFMAEMGFKALEDNGMDGREVALQKEIGEELGRSGMDMGVFVAHIAPPAKSFSIFTINRSRKAT